MKKEINFNQYEKAQDATKKFAQWSDQAIDSKDGGSYVYVHE